MTSKYYKDAKKLIAAAKEHGSYNDETVAFWICNWRGYVDHAQKMWRANERRHSIKGFNNRTAAVLDTIKRAPKRSANAKAQPAAQNL